MQRRIIVCSVMIGVLALGANALAQSDSGAPSARGMGFAVSGSAGVPGVPGVAPANSLSGLRLDTSETWWGLPDGGREVQLGVVLAPRLGTGLPYPGLALPHRDQSPVELGPGLRWRSEAGVFSASFRFDPTGATQGESLRLDFSRPLVSHEGFRLLAYVGAEWQSGRTATVITSFGSTGDTRSLYSSGSSANVGFGLDTHYQVTRNSAIVVGASGLRFGGVPVAGALFADRWQATLYGGYSFRF